MDLGWGFGVSKSLPGLSGPSSTHTSPASREPGRWEAWSVTGHVSPGATPVPAAEGACGRRVSPALRAVPRSLTRLDGGDRGGTGFQRPRQTFGEDGVQNLGNQQKS